MEILKKLLENITKFALRLTPRGAECAAAKPTAHRAVPHFSIVKFQHGKMGNVVGLSGAVAVIRTPPLGAKMERVLFYKLFNILRVFKNTTFSGRFAIIVF